MLDTMGARLNAPRQALETLVRAGLEQRGAPPEAAPDMVAVVVAALFDGLVRQRLLNAASVPDELFSLALKWLFTGISTAAGSAVPPAKPEGEGKSD